MAEQSKQARFPSISYANNPGHAQYNNSPKVRSQPQPEESHISHYVQQVDSWRSYKHDSTNLQSVANPRSALNPAANTFRTANVNYGPACLAAYQPPRYNTRSQTRAFHQPWRAGHDPSRPVPSIETVDEIPRQYGRMTRRGYGRQSTPRRTVSPPPAPEATEEYLTQAAKLPICLASSKKLLVILDLNGTLLFRPNRSVNPTEINIRPGVTALLQYLFENHKVMIYTSAQPENASKIVENLLPTSQRSQLAAVWARDKLDLNKFQYREKVQVYKKLEKVWNDPAIQATAEPGDQWNQSNTILVDDSKLKALAQPHNLLQVPEYTKEDSPSSKKFKTTKAKARASKIQQDLLKQLELKLEDLRWQEDVSRQIRLWQTGEVAAPQVLGQEVVVEETVDQKALQAQKAKEQEEEQKQTHLPTPTSLADEDESDGEADMDLSNSDDEEEAKVPRDTPLSPERDLQRSEQKTDATLDKLADRIPGLAELNDQSPKAEAVDTSRNARETRSVSPIDPNVWKEILGSDDNPGKGQKGQASQRRESSTLPKSFIDA